MVSRIVPIQSCHYPLEGYNSRAGYQALRVCVIYSGAPVKAGTGHSRYGTEVSPLAASASSTC